MADIKALLADPEFKTLSLEGQKKALGRLDPELGGLSDSGFLKFVYQVAPPAGTEKLVGGLPSPLGAPLDPLRPESGREWGGPPILPRSGSPFVQDLNQEPVRHTLSTFRAYPGRAGSQTPFPDPVQDWIGEGMRKMGEGAAQAGSPGQEGTTPTNQILGGASKMYRGGMQAAAPFVLPGAIATAPGSLLVGGALGMAGGAGTEAGLNALQVSPEKSAFAGDVVGTLAALGSGALTRLGGKAYDFAKGSPAVRKIILKNLKIPFLGDVASELWDYTHPEPTPFKPSIPAVTPQGRGLPGFPKSPGAPEPWAAPRLTQQGQGGLVGLPKPPEVPGSKQWPVPRVTFKTPISEKPFNPGLPPPPQFKPQAPTEKPFSPPVPKLTYPGWTAKGGSGKGLAGELTEAQVNAEIAKWKSQQPEPRQPANPRASSLEIQPEDRIRPEQTNPAAQPEGGRLYSDTKNAHQEINSQIHAQGRKMDLPGSPPGKNISVDQMAGEVYGKPWHDLTLDEKSALNEHLQGTKSWPTRQAMGLPPL